MTDSRVSMPILLCLAACAPSPSTHEDAILALQAESAAMREEVAALTAEVEVMRERVTALETRPRPAPAPKEPGPVCTARADGSYTVPGGLDAQLLSKEARAIPHRDATGEYDGYRMSAIRRGHLLDSCGLKNGDIVHAMNGRALVTTEAALAAHGEYADGGELRFTVTRRNAPVELVLHPEP